jgi:hypothetical protein
VITNRASEDTVITIVRGHSDYGPCARDGTQPCCVVLSFKGDQVGGVWSQDLGVMIQLCCV